MKNKKMLFTLSVVGAVSVVTGVFYGNSILADSPTQEIQAQLSEEGIQVSEISKKEETLRLETESTSNSSEATIEDIKSIRTIRNELRSETGKRARVQGLDLTITSSNGQEVYNSTSDDITKIPDFSSKILGSLASDAVHALVTSDLKEKGVILESISISDNPLGGKLAEIQIKAEHSDANNLVPKIEEWITMLNTSSETGISQYELTISDKTRDDTLLYLTADLVYRDFLWWQSPALGEDTWTHSKPQSQEEANSKDRIPAVLEEGIEAGPPGADNAGIEGPQF